MMGLRRELLERLDRGKRAVEVEGLERLEVRAAREA